MYVKAESLLKRALSIDQKALGPENPAVATDLLNLADCYRDQGRYSEAESLYTRSLAMDESLLGPENPNVADGLESVSRYYRLTGDMKESVAAAHRALGIRQANFRSCAVVMSDKDALTYSQFLRNSLCNYLSCEFGPVSGGSDAGNEAANAVLSCKGQVSDGIFQRQRALVQERDSTTLALAEALRYTKFEISELFVEGPGEDVSGYRIMVDSLTKVANDLDAQLSRRSTSFRQQRRFGDVGSAQISDVLQEGAALVEYLRYDYQELASATQVPHYLVIVLTRSADPTLLDLGEACQIDALVDQYRSHMLRVSSAGEAPSVLDLENYRDIAEGLYGKIWRPVEQHVSSKDLILVAADGALNMISFAGLIDGNGQYLIEHHPIHYLSAGRDAIRYRDEAPPGEGLLAMGDPDYSASAPERLWVRANTRQNGLTVACSTTRNVRSGCGRLDEIGVAPLPGTRNEINQIASKWAESTREPAVICFGREASEERLKADAPGKRVIHLATHGYFLEGTCVPEVPANGLSSRSGFVGENPLLLSGLFLAGANLHGAGADSAGAEDGILTAYEVSAMNLEATQLVVLSACETGLGKVEEGEGVYGLRRAFQMAGARTVVSALWPVSDEATADMMSKLYGKRHQSIPETMRRIQWEKIRDLRRHKQPDHPFTWAGFIATGDWR